MVVAMEAQKTIIHFSQQRLHLAAIAAGVTLAEVAKALGVATSTFDMKWRGRRRWTESELDAVERILNVTTAWLAGGAGEERKP